MGATSIGWTERTWNPVVGCTWKSVGCDNCYAARMTRRLEAMGKTDYIGLTTHANFNGEVRTLEHRLEDPMKWRKPSMVFVNSMSDLFHDDVPQWFIHDVLHAIKACPQHTFQILTKRPGRAAHIDWACSKHREDYRNLPNLWLGASCENQQVADDRIPQLIECPAAVRFLSLEPLLGPIDRLNLAGIHWVIIGCESGPNRRPMNLEWAESIVEQCRFLGVPVFVKQLVIDGKICTDMTQFPEALRFQEFPK